MTHIKLKIVAPYKQGKKNIMIQISNLIVLVSYNDPTDLQGVQNDRVSLAKKSVLVAKCRSPVSGQEPARLVRKHSVRP